MESISLTSLAAEKLAEAQQTHSGRAAHTIHGGHTHELRQTVLALLAGHDLSEHDSPGEATLQVLQGHVCLTAGEDAWNGRAGDYVAIPPTRHALHAVEDSVIMLTVLACNMNHALITGVADALAPHSPAVRLAPGPARCCVVLKRCSAHDPE